MRLVATSPSVGPAPMSREEVATVQGLFETHADGVFRLAMVMLGRTDAAEDVVQETFLKLLRHLSDARPLPNARGWLFTVAAHACRDRQRSQRRWLPWTGDYDARTAPEQPDAALARDAVLTAIRRLSPRDRLLIALRAEGLDYGHIAEAAGLRPSSTGRILARALDRLARELDSAGATS
jgi:RNA polymerase sigma-70 factor, ECF subfamily